MISEQKWVHFNVGHPDDDEFEFHIDQSRADKCTKHHIHNTVWNAGALPFPQHAESMLKRTL